VEDEEAEDKVEVEVDLVEEDGMMGRARIARYESRSLDIQMKGERDCHVEGAEPIK
jgi:hypothetical protein